MPTPGDPESQQVKRQNDTAPLRRPGPASVSTSRARWLGTFGLIVGLTATAVLSVTTYLLNGRNEHQLLDQQVRQAGQVVTAAAGSISTPLAGTAAIVGYTHGRVAAFKQSAAPLIGPKSFASVSFWQIDGPAPRLIASVGEKPSLNPSSADGRSFLEDAARSDSVAVNPNLGGPVRRLGYAVIARTSAHVYAIYGERVLASQQATPKPTSPFADLNYALYLGRAPRPNDLIVRNVAHLPLNGPTYSLTVPFGNSAITIVASAGEPLSTFGSNFWWIIVIVGAALSFAAAFAVLRLERLRNRSEVFATQQRSIAETLQRGLLPARLPVVAGMEINARYVPGVEGLEIGGDWYSAVERDDHQVVFIVGDVAGRGVRAATLMASLRFTVRTYALEGYPPGAVLERCARILDFNPGEFATVLCGLIDLKDGQLSIANAGHMPPVLLDASGASFISVPPGPPIGVSAQPNYPTMAIPLPLTGTLIGYTDGLIERRGENIDVGLERLRNAAQASDGLDVGDLLDGLLAQLAARGAADDIALIALRWSRALAQPVGVGPLPHGMEQLQGAGNPIAAV